MEDRNMGIRPVTIQDVDQLFKDLGATGFVDLPSSGSRVYVRPDETEVGTCTMVLIKHLKWLKVSPGKKVIIGNGIQIWDARARLPLRFNGRIQPLS
jgi:hypothetical protein